MANLTKARAAHATLSGVTVDTVTLTGQGIKAVEVSNRAGATTIFFTTDGSTPSASGDDTDYVMPGEAVTVAPRSTTGVGVVVKLIGNGNDYSVSAVDA